MDNEKIYTMLLNKIIKLSEENKLLKEELDDLQDEYDELQDEYDELEEELAQYKGVKTNE